MNIVAQVKTTNGKEVNLREQNLSLKCCQSLEQNLYYWQGLDLPKEVMWLSVGQNIL